MTKIFCELNSGDACHKKKKNNNNNNNNNNELSRKGKLNGLKLCCLKMHYIRILTSIYFN